MLFRAAWGIVRNNYRINVVDRSARKNNLQEGPLWHYGHPIYRVKAGLPDKDLN